MEWLPPERYAAELEAETARFAAAALAQPDDRTVPTCPEWTFRDLVTHVGTGHRYAKLIIDTDQMQPYTLIPAPITRADWPSWLTSGARDLIRTVHHRGFHQQVWTFQPKHLIAGFWLRRMVHDLIIHRFDATPDGHPHGDLALDLAADGISDLLGTFEMFDRLAGTGETLQFTAPDAARTWRVTRTETGLTWHDTEAQPGAPTPPDASIEAPARKLLLILNRRLPPPTAQGNQQVWTSWYENSRF
ncbi:maleylpyruvate isomerase N-terminal domain-containing protein [Actinoplanes sp. NPDC049596]|uniref:maleylpyruvate isomerase N-terminal domain-containing protein n=1 Tax=unclassified Actinoplanes TaxID=2626549 RepID=UPI00342BE013